MAPAGSFYLRRKSGLKRGFLRPALAHQQLPDVFQQHGRPVHSLGQENVGAGFTLIDLDLAGKENGRGFRRQGFYRINQLHPVKLRHGQIAQDQVHAALLEDRQGVSSIVAGQHTVATGFKDYFSNREKLVIVVYTEDRFFCLPGDSITAASCPRAEAESGHAFFTTVSWLDDIANTAIKNVKASYGEAVAL